MISGRIAPEVLDAGRGRNETLTTPSPYIHGGVSSSIHNYVLKKSERSSRPHIEERDTNHDTSAAVMPSEYSYGQSMVVPVPHKQLPQRCLVLALELQSVRKADIRATVSVAYPKLQHATQTSGSRGPRRSRHVPVFPPAQLVVVVILLQFQHHLPLGVVVLLKRELRSVSQVF